MNAPDQRPVTDRIPPQLYIVGSGLIQYVGAALAVIAFASVEPASVAWWRVLTGAVVLLPGSARGAAASRAPTWLFPRSSASSS